jgi:hypothetical protein
MDNVLRAGAGRRRWCEPSRAGARSPEGRALLATTRSSPSTTCATASARRSVAILHSSRSASSSRRSASRLRARTAVVGWGSFPAPAPPARDAGVGRYVHPAQSAPTPHTASATTATTTSRYAGSPAGRAPRLTTSAPARSPRPCAGLRPGEPADASASAPQAVAGPSSGTGLPAASGARPVEASRARHVRRREPQRTGQSPRVARRYVRAQG